MGPEELGRFRLHRVLGRGGRPGVFGGEVWEAEEIAGRGRVALKIVRVDDEAALGGLERFTDHARRMKLVRHPNLALVLDAGEAAGTSFVVMELVRGRALGAMVREGASAEGRTGWLRDVAGALAALHEAGLVHGDVKEDNVLVRDDGTACLVDLGACFDDEGQGEDPLRDQTAWARLARDVLGADAPDEVFRVIERAGAQDSAVRLSSMTEVAAALPSTAVAHVPPPPPSRPHDGGASVPRRLSPWVAAALFVALLALAVLLQRALLD